MRMSETEVERLSKKAKLEISTDTKLSVLNEFEFSKILSENPTSKFLTILATKKKTSQENDSENKENGNGENHSECTNQNAVIVFEKPHFSLDETKSFLQNHNEMDVNLINDIYNKLTVYPSKPFNHVQVQLIYPATDAHISKYSYQEMFFIKESYQDWLDITSEYIKKSSFSIQWVYNILDHKTESERIIYEDSDPNDGFILLPDMKWDSKNAENLYMLGIIHRKNIESLRHLTGDHVKLLENLRDKSLKAIEEKFNVKKEKIRAYIHYQPSFYHFHVHFTHIKHDTVGIQERNNQLNQVIENLKLCHDYYQRVTIEYPVRKNDPLYGLYKDRFEPQN